MSKLFQYVTGNFHVMVKLHGPVERIRVFHKILSKVETDWPWEAKWRGTRVKVCSACKGIPISNPRITPMDIKAAAAQAGIGVKIYQFAEADRCPKTSTVEYIRDEQSHVLYSHKPNRIHLGQGQAWIGDIPPSDLRKPFLVDSKGVTVQ